MNKVDFTFKETNILASDLAVWVRRHVSKSFTVKSIRFFGSRVPGFGWSPRSDSDIDVYVGVKEQVERNRLGLEYIGSDDRPFRIDVHVMTHDANNISGLVAYEAEFVNSRINDHQ